MTSYTGFYDLPGGRIDNDEFETSFSEIISREIKYQLQQKPVAVGRHLIPASMTSSGKGVHILYLFFEADYRSGKITISDEHIGYKWINLKKIYLDEYFTSGILEGIKMYLGSSFE